MGAAQVGITNCKLTVNSIDALVELAKVDNAIHNFVLFPIRQHISLQFCNPNIVRYPVQRRMHKTISSKFYWLYVSSNVKKQAFKCTGFDGNNQKYNKNCEMNRFPPAGQDVFSVVLILNEETVEKRFATADFKILIRAI